MTLPQTHPSLPLSPRPADEVAVTASPAASPLDPGVGSNHDSPGRTLGSPAPAAEWSEEKDREAAARYFVNAAADVAISMSLGSLCVRAKCTACGISFLAMTRRDSLCHVCVGEAPR